MFSQWVLLKEAIEHCETTALVNIRAKVIDVGETETVSQKKVKMAESIISRWQNHCFTCPLGKRCYREKKEKL